MIQLKDSFGRIPRKLRVAVTDRCNLRCKFCMPEAPAWLAQDEILTFEEIHRVASLTAEMGVESIRLSGGEPLMRRDLYKLVSMIANVPGIRFIGMTTNGLLLPRTAADLREAGLQGVTISLHSIRPDRFTEITGGGHLNDALAGIEAAQQNEFDPIKINCVVLRDFNDGEVMDLASLAFSNDLTVRFIEFMPFDGRQKWQFEKVVGGNEIIARIRRRYRLIPLPRDQSSTSRVYKFLDGRGEIGIITSVTEPFCTDCNRIRLTADGKILPCLFDTSSYDLRPLLRGGASDLELSRFIRDAVARKPPGVQALLKEHQPLQHVRPMYTVGG